MVWLPGLRSSEFPVQLEPDIELDLLSDDELAAVLNAEVLRPVFRTCHLIPVESAGKRRDGSTNREGSVQLRWTLIDLGIGLRRADAVARGYGQQLRARGKKGGVIGCAMANCANRIAYWSVTSPATTRTAGPDRTGGFLDRCPPRRAQQRAIWSARSAARTNGLIAASSDPQSVGEEAREKDLT